ncbi:MAG: NADPH-dependent oxidoreductase [Polyangiaceae bacterium]
MTFSPTPASGPDERQLYKLRYGHTPAASGVVERAAAHARAAVLPHLLEHRSVRQYSPEPLAEGTVERLVAAAQSAASSSNLQLWSVISVEDAARRRLLSEAAGKQAHIRDCPTFLVWIADLHRAAALAQDQGLPSEALDYLEMFLMASVDAALAAQNAVVAAESLGLGTVYIGALRNDPVHVAEVLGLPSQTFALFGLCVGWAAPDKSPAIKPRLPQSVVLHRDRYQYGTEQQLAVKGYDELMQRFYSSQQMQNPAGGWSRHSAQRLATAAGLHGRHVLRDVLARLGFPLK